MVTNKQFNGWWEILFKINQVIMPLFMGWAIWVTGNIFNMNNYINSQPKAVSQDMVILEKDLKSWTSENFASIVIISDIKQMKNDMADLKSSMSLLSYQLLNNDDIKRR